jgi:hypothetical protein
MIKWKYLFLTLSLTGITLGLAAPVSNEFFNFGLPLGATFFGLFMIFQFLQKESALYDEQQRAAVSAHTVQTTGKPPPVSQKEAAHNPALTMARSH